jgi:hypothetical protein
MGMNLIGAVKAQKSKLRCKMLSQYDFIDFYQQTDEGEPLMPTFENYFPAHGSKCHFA